MGNTLFDPELYQKAQEESRYLLQNMVAPPGPPPTAEKPKEEKPTSPVTINIGEGIKWNPQVEGQPNIWQRMFSGRGGEEWYPPWMAEAQPFGPIPTKAIGPITPVLPPARETGGTGPSWKTIQDAIYRASGIQPGITDLRTGAQFTQEQADRLFNTPIPLRNENVSNALPFVKEVLPSGETRYVLEGGQGTLTLPKGWNAAEEGRKFMANFQPTVPGPIAPREISTYQAGEYPVMIGGRQVMMPRFVTGVEGAPGTGTREEWANYMARRPTEEPPTWTIPPAIEKQMGDLMKIIQSPDTWSGQRHAAAQALGDLGRMVAEQNRMARGAYEFGASFPLKEREVAAHEAGIPLRQYEAETHRFAAEQLAKHQEQIGKYFNVGAGQTVLNREGKPVYQAPFAPEHTSAIMHYAIAGSTEESPMGQKTINPMTFVGLMNMMGSRLGGGYKPITMKEVPKEWITPYIEGRIKKVKPNLKADTEEYRKLHKAYEDLLYMTGQ
jgi:hypothetical protein